MRQSPNFRQWMAEARKLPWRELVRHAKVSHDNRHECRECFCCACLVEVRRGGLVHELRKG